MQRRHTSCGSEVGSQSTDTACKKTPQCNQPSSSENVEERLMGGETGDSNEPSNELPEMKSPSRGCDMAQGDQPVTQAGTNDVQDKEQEQQEDVYILEESKPATFGDVFSDNELQDDSRYPIETC